VTRSIAVVPGGTGTSNQLIGFEITLPTTFYVVGLAQGAPVDLHIARHRNSSTSTTYSYDEIWRRRIVLRRADGDSVSIDSRRMHGQPNAGDPRPGVDPNAPPRNVNFSGWRHNGGLFVGNAPPATRDQSGVARIQSYFTMPTMVTIEAAAYVVRNLGFAAQMGGTCSLSAAGPNGTDAHLLVGPQDVTWATRWSLPSTLDPTGSVAMGGLPIGEYLNLRPTNLSIVGGVARCAVVLQGEADYVTNGQPAWRYFASPASEAAGQAPANSKPHLNLLDRTLADIYYGFENSGSPSTGSTTTGGGWQ